MENKTAMETEAHCESVCLFIVGQTGEQMHRHTDGRIAGLCGVRGSCICSAPSLSGLSAPFCDGQVDR